MRDQIVFYCVVTSTFILTLEFVFVVYLLLKNKTKKGLYLWMN